MTKRILLPPLLASVALAADAAETVRNGNLGRRGANPPYFTQDSVRKLRDSGWTCPDVDQWPWWWNAYGERVTLDWPRQGGRVSGHGRINGTGGFVTGYYGHPITSDLVLSVWVRGSGKLQPGLMAYALVEGKTRGIAPVAAAPVTVNSKQWIRVRCLLRKTPELHTGHVTIGCPEGTIDFDEVDLRHATPADGLVVAEEERLRAAGGLIENVDVVLVDAAFRRHATRYREAVAEFEKTADQVDAPLREGLQASVKTLDPYVLGKSKTAIHALHYNEMLVLTGVLKVLAGQPPPAATPVSSAPAPSPTGHRPGEREARTNTVTVTDVRSNKVRYNENERAVTKATVVNTTERERAGTLVAVMHLDVNAQREVARTPFQIGPGATKTWSFSYPVGPETYGRGLEVRFVDADGRTVDSWQEFYAVAAEWFRVQQHTTNNTMKSYTVDPWVTYFNQEHNFASEPTDWGVQVDAAKDLEDYISSQPLYRLNLPARRARYAHLKRQGVMGTFYQTFAWSGQMGYEVIRQHPEFALYDANGQFAVDPVYGGYPNPMELASPLETGPKRTVTKPYLDRKLSSWQHGVVNYAREDVVRYMAQRIREHAEFLNCSGVYVDGNLGVWKGYGYDGKLNVPSDEYQDYVRLGARNHRLFSGMLKKDNPNFGTWFNWAAGAGDYYWVKRGLTFYLGSGWGEYDPRDDSIRAAADWKNVMFLNETRGQFAPGRDGPQRYPAEHLDMLSDNRDYLVQGYGANVLLGYVGNYNGISLDAPGPDRWGWATHNWFGAQLIATQTHIASWFAPSWRPTLQFMTRYSRLIWAPDVKVVPHAEQLVQVDGPEALWWKRLVYRRATDKGYDLIVHLVRKPPYETWDLTWLDEPDPLEGVRIRIHPDPAGHVVETAYAMRPYYFDEPQQPVQRALEAKTGNGSIEAEVPEFRYHTMVVARVNTP